MPLTVLMTGVAGFLGSHLLTRLLENGHEVVGIDNLSHGSLDNIAAHSGDPRFVFIRGDVTEATVFDQLPPVDVVVHLAAYKIPRYGNALETLRTNTRGTENVLEHGRRVGARCVLASTSDVYGANPSGPFHEETSSSVFGASTSARWAYAVSKLHGEHLAFAYRETFNLPILVLRLFGAYGPHQHLSWWGGPVPVFISAVLESTPVPIHGDGSQTRTFTYVDDTVEALYTAVRRTELNGMVINVGHDEAVSILALAERIKRLSGIGGTLDYRLVPYESFTGGRYDEVAHRVPDNRRCRELLGCTPRVGLDEGLARTISWQRQRLRGA